MSEMYICPKAKECKKCPNPHHKYPHELIVAGYSDACDDLRGGCPACIPVEPEPTCPDCNGKGINPFKFPDAICPCGHPKSEHIGTYNCQHKDSEGYFTCLSYHCSTPADLKPSEPKCEAIQCNNPATETLVSSVCPSITFNLCSEHAKSYLKTGGQAEPAEPQAEMMPLLEVFDKEHNKIICIDSVEAIIREQRDTDMAWHEKKCSECIGFYTPMDAHDAEVASKAVKEFAEKIDLRLQEEMHHPELSEWDSGYQKALQDSLAHIRAMAEGVER